MKILPWEPVHQLLPAWQGNIIWMGTGGILPSLWVIFSLASLTDFGRNPNATHTLFFLVLCFAQNPIKWAICRMTKLVNRTVFFRVVDYGWKSWFCLFALIKYRWITWAADNLFSSRKKKKKIILYLYGSWVLFLQMGRRTKWKQYYSVTLV